MSPTRRRGPAETQLLEALLTPKALTPVLIAAFCIAVVLNSARLQSAKGIDAQASTARPEPVLVDPPSDRLVARLRFAADDRPVRIGPHVFIAVSDVPPGTLVARFRLETLPRDRTTPWRYRCFWTTGDWSFRPDGFSWLPWDNGWIVSSPFDPAPDQHSRYELRLRFDFGEHAERTEIAELEVYRRPAGATATAPKVEIRDAWYTELGTPIVVEAQPWGSGFIRSAVGFRVRSPAGRPIPVRVTATVDGGGTAPAGGLTLEIPDITRVHSYTPEWIPFSVDLTAFRGRRVRVVLLAQPLDSSATPEHCSVLFAKARIY